MSAYSTLWNWVMRFKNTDVNSIDFWVNRFIMKPFKTNNMYAIQDCLLYFNFKLPSRLLASRTAKFLAKYNTCDNRLLIHWLILCTMSRTRANCVANSTEIKVSSSCLFSYCIGEWRFKQKRVSHRSPCLSAIAENNRLWAWFNSIIWLFVCAS